MSQLTIVKEFIFRFNKDKQGFQRPRVPLNLPVPTWEGLLEAGKEPGKVRDLILESVESTVRGIAAGIVGADEKISQETFPMAEISLEAIANMERAERRTIPQEKWAAFAEDYVRVMQSVAPNYTPDQLGNQVFVWMKKVTPIKGKANLLPKFQALLTMYMEQPSSEEYIDIIEVLARRLEAYIAAADSEQAVLSNLGV